MDNGWTVSLFSPDTAFLTLCFDNTLPSLEMMSDAVLNAFREEHKDVEHQEVIEQFSGHMSMGHDLQFISFDLTCTAWVRSFFGSAGTFLVLCQLADDELETNEPILRAICESMSLQEE